jgi:hypothetical protein
VTGVFLDKTKRPVCLELVRIRRIDWMYMLGGVGFLVFFSYLAASKLN